MSFNNRFIRFIKLSCFFFLDLKFKIKSDCESFDLIFLFLNKKMKNLNNKEEIVTFNLNGDNSGDNNLIQLNNNNNNYYYNQRKSQFRWFFFSPSSY